ncbi:hypothetical protein B0H16DRAFT_1475501 [Mycena metata]|uniref:Uncharacterized protein n=1 Tax=Mycena metata TaxID=1033252 RepID=A0AAD7HEY2_9AGAR|nr:hypothetical protein B0H16DRAFT_1475501 [Mycena metata]
MASNGTSLETASPGRLTSWQDSGESVSIDYAIVSDSLLLVRKFEVTCPAVFEEDDWSDHMQICMTLDASAFKQTPLPARDPQPRPDFSGSSYIDELYQATIDSKQTPDEALDLLWGFTQVDSPPIHI